MTLRFAAVLLVCLWLVLAPALTQAQTSVVQHRDGTTNLGDDVGIHSDAHGNGDTKSGSVTTFDMPPQPNHLTAPPVLPVNPNRPLVPQQPSAPLSSNPPLGFHPSGGGRFGR